MKVSRDKRREVEMGFGYPYLVTLTLLSLITINTLTTANLDWKAAACAPFRGCTLSTTMDTEKPIKYSQSPELYPLENSQSQKRILLRTVSMLREISGELNPDQVLPSTRSNFVAANFVEFRNDLRSKLPSLPRVRAQRGMHFTETLEARIRTTCFIQLVSLTGGRTGGKKTKEGKRGRSKAREIKRNTRTAPRDDGGQGREKGTIPGTPSEIRVRAYDAAPVYVTPVAEQFPNVNACPWFTYVSRAPRMFRRREQPKKDK